MSTAEIISFVGGSQGSGSVNGVRPRARLGKFVHGQLRHSKVEFDRFSVYESQKDNKKQIMFVESDRMTYVGKNYEEDSNNNTLHDSQRTYLGAFDPKTGKMEVMDVDTFKFKPYFPETEDEEKEKENEADISYIEKNDALTSAFGSKRKRRTMEIRKKNLVTEETLKKVLDSTVREGMEAAVQTQQKLDELEQTDNLLDFILPPYDKYAVEAKDIFNIDDIITEAEMELLMEPSKEFFDSTSATVDEWKKAGKFCPLVIKHLRSLPVNEEVRRKKCCWVLYLHYMITLFTTSDRHITKDKFPLPKEWPHKLKDSLLDKFTGTAATDPAAKKAKADMRSYTKRHNDRLLSYLLILSITLDDFKMSLNDFIPSVKVGKKRVVNHGRMIGFSILSAHNQDASAVLKTPFSIEKKKGSMMKKRN